MCPKPKPMEVVTPADPPAAPLPVADDVKIGKTRKSENVSIHGSKDVTYRRPDNEGMTM